MVKFNTDNPLAPQGRGLGRGDQNSARQRLTSTTFGILIALPPEATCFSSSFRTIGRIYPFGQQSQLCVSGMGELVNPAALNLIKKGAGILISCGTAVGLAPHIKPGTLCLPHQILGSNQEVYNCDPHWRKQIVVRLKDFITIDEGSLLHTPTILKTSQEKQLLHENSGAVSADMESCFIAQTAKMHQIPFLTLRVIIDHAHFNMPEALLKSIGVEGDVDLKKLMSNWCKQPLLFFSLVSLAIHFLKARSVLKRISKMELW